MALVGITRATQFLRIYQISKCSFSFLTEKNVKNAVLSLSYSIPSIKHYCTDNKTAIPAKSAAPHATEESKKRKGLKSPQITLIDSEDDIKLMTLENAEKLAKRRNLKLVKIIDFDTKTERPVFKLMTSSQFFEEDSKVREKKKHEKESAIKDSKIFMISSKIQDHDLSVKVKQMSKALTKKHPVHVYISQEGNPTRAEEIQKIIEDELTDFYSAKDGSRKHTTLKLYLKPIMENQNLDTSKKEKKQKDEVLDKVKVN